jgi:GNAT superfamily N-acetyltransferase
MNMVIKSVNLNSKEEINKFLNNAGNSLSKFRYFKSRDLSVLRNHWLTILGYDDNNPITYGHLDSEEEKLWLGICVAEGYKGRGLGKQTMQKLVETFNEQSYYDSLHRILRL